MIELGKGLRAIVDLLYLPMNSDSKTRRFS
jgi:hypothetical protein